MTSPLFRHIAISSVPSRVRGTHPQIRRALALAVLAVLTSPVLAGTTDDPTDATPNDSIKQFDRVVVIGTRTARAIIDVPNTVDEIDRKRMDDLLMNGLDDLFRYEPGITIGKSTGRFGIGDIRIRGLGGNRVRIQTDGIAVSDAFVIGGFSNANRNFVDLDTLKRVEVVRGPTSSMYGSDALGGTVSFITKDPSDYLKDGKQRYFGLKLGYDGDSRERYAGVTAAITGERWSGMIVADTRASHEPRNLGSVGGVGSTRTQPNPQDHLGRSVLAKLVFTPTAAQQFRLTLERNAGQTETDMLSSLGLQPSIGAINTRVAARDKQWRTRISLDHEIALAYWFADAIDWQVYRQSSQTLQYTIEERTLPPPTLQDIRERWFHFDQTVTGVQINFHKSRDEGAITHDLAWGLDVSRTKTEQRRDGLRHFPLTGVETPNMPPDAFPVRDFPISTSTTAAAYLQDEIGLVDGAFRLVPALRVDYYRLSPTMDSIFAGDNPGVTVVGLTKTNVSPKLGMVWHFAPDWSLFSGYARGFRSPPYADVNIGFTNVMFGYTAIANPNLKSETSDGLELGLRYSSAKAYASLSAYDNRYHDFIESFVFVGFNSAGLMVFQSQNIADARIHGVELKAGLELDALSQALAGWSLRGAAAWSRGEDRTTHDPLESVDPLTATLGLAYADERWGVELAGRFAGRRERMPVAPAGTTYFQSPGYGVVDLYAHWQVRSGLTLNVGVTNLGNRNYWAAGSIPLMSSSSNVLDRYSAPGRAVSASIRLDW